MASELHYYIICTGTTVSFWYWYYVL